MKTNIQIKSEPVELQNYTTKTKNKLLHLYGYNLSEQTVESKSLSNQEPSTCAWCQKLGIKTFTLHTDNVNSKTLCSEICFNQYRRASFKKNKSSEIDFDRRRLAKSNQIKSSTGVVSKSKTTTNNYHQDFNRQKIVLPYRHSTSTKSNGISRRLSSSKRLSTNLPMDVTWPSSVEINRFQYPFVVPPPPLPPARQMPLALPSRTTSTEHLPSTRFSTLSNYACILPTFIPLPIPVPIPLCFPIHLPCVKCSIDVINQQCQTEIGNSIDCFSIHQNRTRRTST